MQYAKRMVGRRMYGGTSTYIPLKVNQAGVIPVIFASSLLYLPSLAVQPRRQQQPARLVAAGSTRTSSRGDHPVYMIAYFGLIVFFTYFYVAITFNPTEVADNMKKYGGFIPGIRAGRPTAEYLDYVLSRITLPGALYLGRHRAHPADRARALRCQPELPVRRHRDPDHRRRRPRDGEADREPAAAAQLRGLPPLVRLVLVGPPGPARAPRPVHRRALRGPEDLHRRHLPGQRQRGHRRSGCEAKKYMDAGDLVPDEVTIAMVEDRLAEPDAERRASCSTASRAPCPRPRCWTRCSAARSVGTRRRARARRRRRRGRPPAVRPAHLPPVRPRLAPRLRPARPRTASATGAAASCSSATTTARTPSGTGSRSTPTRPRRSIGYYGDRGLLAASTPPVRSRT